MCQSIAIAVAYNLQVTTSQVSTYVTMNATRHAAASVLADASVAASWYKYVLKMTCRVTRKER